MSLQRESAVDAHGTPYHLLARTPAHRWWRPLVGILLLIALAVVFLLVISAVGMGLAVLVGIGLDAELGFSAPLWEFAFAFASIAVLLPAVLLTARWAQRRPVGTVSSVEGRLRWRWLLDCGGWAVLGFVLIAVVDLARGQGVDVAAWPGWPTFLAVLAIAVTLVPLQAAAEEYLCRGWLVQTFASWTRTPWPGAVVTSVLFVALHDYTEPLVVADLFVFAMAMCWLTIRTGGLEAAIALHVVNNAAFAVFAGTQGVPSLDQSGSYSVWDVLPTMALTVVYTWWIDRRARRRGIVTRSRPAAAGGTIGAC
ncbi:CPBP family intramembrane glutamic endopeptidase [Saccharopolyspora elongata]|uniref:CPBP family intramembrane metalloprotease n=1 Tax=Saccharopolyspora elongata TaxID=2530387 RepID=A0A4R4YHR7_9PSEU|nr:type II CAAX endopeptidase family protein [Saccharopolyspora elongata]TDD43489.1 CPBP family intramembrane metalloprotease [Saccharopolyspora elongata]